MQTKRSIWTPLLLPTLLGGFGASLCTYIVLGSPAAAAFVLGGCAICLMGTATVLSRNAREAEARLRRPEIRSQPNGNLGVFRGIVDEAVVLLEASETIARDSAQARAEIEARSNVRRKQTRRLEAALNSLDDPLLITDTREQVVFCNPAAASLFGLEDLGRKNEGNDTAKQPTDLNRIGELKQLLTETRDRNAATSRRTAELELSVGAQTIAYRATATNLSDDDDTLLGLLAILSDIRNERQDKERHAEFLSAVCHELKTPMASIRAYTELLIDGDVSQPDEQNELYGFIEEQVDRLTRLVNNMLNLTRIESGVIKVCREDCGLNEVLAKAVSVVQQLAEEKQQCLQTELSELYVPVNVDKDLLGQAVINLLSNAVKYTPEAGRIRLRSRLDENLAIIEVRDTGMGIPEDSLPHIFDRFYRVPQNNQAAPGTGLGLALVQYIVTELHNGSISVDSEVGQGTTFTISLPLGHRDQNRRKQTALLSAT